MGQGLDQNAPLSTVATCNGLVFVGLNLADAWLTKQLIAIGSWEGNPIVASYGDNMLIKGVLALAIVLILARFGRLKLLWVLNVAILAVVFWNGAWLFNLLW